jgi:hypothetical protein
MSIVSIGEVLVDRELLDALFCCNLDACRGACCVEGELGAPLDQREEQVLMDAAGCLHSFLPRRNMRYIRKHGCTELYQGSLYTRTIEGRECVFTIIQGSVTFCAIELACAQGIIQENKPLSCRLFPIRVRKKFGLDYLVYEQHGMCREARRQGSLNNIRLIDFLGEALKERYGTNWYESLKAFVDSSP